MVKEQCSRLKETLSSISDGASGGASADSLAKLAQMGKLLLMEVKDSMRQQSEGLETLRDETMSAKAELDSLNLVLQNLLYEKSHYEKEIRTCEDFRSAHSDEDISLLDLDQYAKLSGDAAAAEDHETMLRRLAHEIERRKQLHARLEEVKKARAVAEASEGKQQRFLKGLVDQLKGVDKAAKAIKSQLQVQRGALAFLTRHAELLPAPMYILYSQLAACIDAHDLAARIAINGSLEDAEAAAAATGAGDDTAEACEADAEGDVDMIDLEGQGRKKKHKAVASAAAAAGKKEQDLYEKHPLSVTLTLLNSQSDTTELLGVTFSFLPRLNIVTAEATAPEDNVLLANLFPGDIGADSPNEANSQLQGGTFQYDKALAARPYRWAQHLAGLDFLPAVPPSAAGESADVVVSGVSTYRSQARHSVVMKQLRARKEGSVGLKAQLSSLSKCSLPLKELHPSLQVVKSKIASWKEIAGSGGGGMMLLSAAYARLEEAERGTWATLGLRSFQFVLQRGDVKLDAQLDVTLEYPLRPPVLRLTRMRWPVKEGGSKHSGAVHLPKAELATFEAEMNVKTANLITSSTSAMATSLVAWQVATLMVAFDVYADQALTQRSFRSATDAPAPPPDTRGRDMQRPAAS